MQGHIFVHNNQRGQILLYAVLALAILATLSGIAWKIRESGKDAIRIEWAAANAKEEARKLEEKKQRDELTAKREADNAKRYATLDARYRAALIGLRQPAGDGQAKPLSSAAAELACPDRQADAAGRLERLEIGVLGLLERGDKAITRTMTCQAWLEEQMKVQ